METSRVDSTAGRRGRALNVSCSLPYCNHFGSGWPFGKGKRLPLPSSAANASFCCSIKEYLPVRSPKLRAGRASEPREIDRSNLTVEPGDPGNGSRCPITTMEPCRICKVCLCFCGRIGELRYPGRLGMPSSEIVPRREPPGGPEPQAMVFAVGVGGGRARSQGWARGCKVWALGAARRGAFCCGAATASGGGLVGSS